MCQESRFDLTIQKLLRQAIVSIRWISAHPAKEKVTTHAARGSSAGHGCARSRRWRRSFGARQRRLLLTVAFAICFCRPNDADPLRKRIRIGLNMDLIVQFLAQHIPQTNNQATLDDARPPNHRGDMRTWHRTKPRLVSQNSHNGLVGGDSTWEGPRPMSSKAMAGRRPTPRTIYRHLKSSTTGPVHVDDSCLISS